MAFRFSLESVLRFREHLEKNEERALVQINAEIARTMRQITDLDAAVVGFYASREASMVQGAPASELQWLLLQQESAGKQKKNLLQDLELLEKKRIHQLNLYREAHRNCEMLTEMRQEQRATYDQERVRKEQKMLDDIFVARRLQN